MRVLARWSRRLDDRRAAARGNLRPPPRPGARALPEPRDPGWPWARIGLGITRERAERLGGSGTTILVALDRATRITWSAPLGTPSPGVEWIVGQVILP